MKKSIIPLSALITLIVCCHLKPDVSVFRNFREDSFVISPFGTCGCEISVKNNKGLVKKYFTNNINSACSLNCYDFNGDGEKEICITDGENYEIINFSKDIPIRISKTEDFTPISMNFTKNEDSVTGFVPNGQTFEIFPEDINSPLTLSPKREISFTDYDNNGIYEICITQHIKNQSGNTVYRINTYRVFSNKRFENEKIKITAVG